MFQNVMDISKAQNICLRKTLMTNNSTFNDVLYFRIEPLTLQAPLSHSSLRYLKIGHMWAFEYIQHFEHVENR